MPIGNLTSQIFANIYLNELDRFLKHSLKPEAYLRYGYDFFYREQTTSFLKDKLHLRVNPKSDKIIKFEHGIQFLGVILWPNGRTLNKRNIKRVRKRLKLNNVPSYKGLIGNHCSIRYLKGFNWAICDMLNIF